MNVKTLKDTCKFAKYRLAHPRQGDSLKSIKRTYKYCKARLNQIQGE